MKHGVRSFRVHPKIKFASWRQCKFRIVAHRINAAAHDDQFFRQLREMRIQSNGKGEIGHRSSRVNGYVVGILMDHADHEMRRVFRGWLCGGSAFGQRRNFVRAVDTVAPGKIPCALVKDLAVERFPLGDVFLGANQRKYRSGNHRDVRAANNFHKPQSVLHFFIPPVVAGENGDAKNIGFRRIDNRKNGLHVGAARA